MHHTLVTELGRSVIISEIIDVYSNIQMQLIYAVDILNLKQVLHRAFHDFRA
jgi:hypothetical protein